MYRSPVYLPLFLVAALLTGRSASAQSRDLVLHAAGAVEFMAPPKWKVAEAPWGREFRVVLTPPERKKKTPLFEDSIWLVYHVRPVRPENWQTELQRLLAKRRRQLRAARVESSSSWDRKIDGWPAMGESMRRERPRLSEKSTTVYHQFVYIRTDWGVCEWCAAASEESFPERKKIFEELLRSLRLRAPKSRRGQVHPTVRSAAPVLGAWKAYRSRLRLHEDGQLTIVHDLPHRTVLDGRSTNSPKKTDNQPEALTGRFQAQKDLLLIEFDDGSKLNLRWRLDAGELLITDHRGHISRLKQYLPAN